MSSCQAWMWCCIPNLLMRHKIKLLCAWYAWLSLLVGTCYKLPYIIPFSILLLPRFQSSAQMLELIQLPSSFIWLCKFIWPVLMDTYVRFADNVKTWRSEMKLLFLFLTSFFFCSFMWNVSQCLYLDCRWQLQAIHLILSVLSKLHL